MALPHRTSRANVLVLSFALLSASIGCANDCPAEDPIRYEDGFTDPTGTTYRSSDPEGPFLHFPGGRVYDLVHGLREQPISIVPYVSFKERLGNMSLSPGNQSVISLGETFIRIQNATCAEFYLYVFATTTPIGAPAPSDAGTIVDSAVE